jgi:hypothetical protein
MSAHSMEAIKKGRLTEKSAKGALAEANPSVIERLCRDEWKEAEREEKDKLRGVDRDAT